MGLRELHRDVQPGVPEGQGGQSRRHDWRWIVGTKFKHFRLNPVQISSQVHIPQVVEVTTLLTYPGSGGMLTRDSWMPLSIGWSSKWGRTLSALMETSRIHAGRMITGMGLKKDISC